MEWLVVGGDVEASVAERYIFEVAVCGDEDEFKKRDILSVLRFYHVVLHALSCELVHVT